MSTLTALEAPTAISGHSAVAMTTVTVVTVIAIITMAVRAMAVLTAVAAVATYTAVCLATAGTAVILARVAETADRVPAGVGVDAALTAAVPTALSRMWIATLRAGGSITVVSSSISGSGGSSVPSFPGAAKATLARALEVIPAVMGARERMTALVVCAVVFLFSPAVFLRGICIHGLCLGASRVSPRREQRHRGTAVFTGDSVRK